MKLSEIHIRDPFILPYEGKYYLFGSPGKYAWQGGEGFYCNISEDLENWSSRSNALMRPKVFGRMKTTGHPRCIIITDGFICLHRFFATGHMRAVQVLAADKPRDRMRYGAFR